MLENIGNMFVPLVTIACLSVGYTLKKIKKLKNDYIPIVLAILGAILNVIYTLENNSPVLLETVVCGILSGLASTGLHQAFKRIIEGNYQADEESE